MNPSSIAKYFGVSVLACIVVAGSALAAPVNDDLADASDLGSGDHFTMTGTTQGSSLEPGESEALDGGLAPAGSVWFRFVPNHTAYYKITVPGGPPDFLRLMQGETFEAMRLSDLQRPYPAFTAGESYLLRVRGAGSSFSVSIDLLPVITNTSAATALDLGQATTAHVSLEAGTDVSWPWLPDGTRGSSYYRWTAPANGVLMVSGGLRLGILTGPEADLQPAPESMVVSTFTGDAGRLHARAGTTYFLTNLVHEIAIVHMDLDFLPDLPLQNDAFAQAEDLGSVLPVVSEIGNADATAQDGEPLTGGLEEVPQSTIWWKWTSPLTGFVSFSLADAPQLLPAYNESAVNYERVVDLDIFTGESLSTLTLLRRAEAVSMIPVVANAVYYFRLNHKVFAGGGSSLSLSEVTVAPPGNDNFAQRIDLGSTLEGGAFGSVVPADSIYSTVEAGEPLHSSNFNYYGSVWYAWTAPSTGYYRLTPLLNPDEESWAVWVDCSIYRGAAVDALAPAALYREHSYQNHRGDYTVSVFRANQGDTFAIAAVSAGPTDFGIDIRQAFSNWYETLAVDQGLDPATTGALNANPAGDGIPNWQKWYFDLDPRLNYQNDPNKENLPKLVSDSISLEISYRLSTNALSPALLHKGEISTDLVEWTPIESEAQPDGSWRIRVPKDTPRKFVRVSLADPGD
jgi:hypothetical protein